MAIALFNYCKILATVTILTRVIIKLKIPSGQNVGDEKSLGQRVMQNLNGRG